MNKKRILPILLLAALAVSACLVVSGCGAGAQYTVRYHAGGGTEVASVFYAPGEEIAPPQNPTREMFTFSGWYADEAKASPYLFGVMPARDIDLYAKWTPAKSRVLRFDANGGSAVAEAVAYAGGEVLAPEEPARAGFTFNGWYTDAECTKRFSFPAAMPDADTTLYAGWSLAEGNAEVRFIANGVLWGTRIIERNAALAEPDLGAGYTVPGWYTDEAMTAAYDFTSPVTDSMTLYASYYSEGLAVERGVVTGYTGSASRVVIPEKWNGTAVTGIGAYAFYGCAATSYALPDSLAAVGEGAFYRNEYLAEIALPKSCTSVGAYAFYGCARLTRAELPGITTVSDGLFSGCEKLLEATLSESYAAVGQNAFSDCAALKNVDIPASVTAIGGGAFTGSGLISAYIPAGVTEIGTGAFANCKRLADIIVSPDNPAYNETGNNLYSKDRSTLYRYFSAGKTETSFTVPAYTKQIAEGAFEGNDNLKELTLTQSTAHARGILKGMQRLETLTVAHIGDGQGNAFLAYLFGAESPTGSGTDNRLVPETLREVIVTEKISQVPDFAFYGLAHVEKFTLPDTAGRLGNSAFAYSGLRSYALPDTVLVEDLNHAFAGCRSLTAYEVTDTNPNYAAYDGCLYSKDGSMFLRAAQGKRTVEFSPDVRKIAESSFSFGRLEAVAVPEWVEEIEKGAFYGCDALGAVSVPFLGRDRAAGDASRDGYDSATSLDYFSYIFGATKTASPGSNGRTLVSVDSKNYVPLTLNRVELTGAHTAVPDYAFYAVNADEIAVPDTVTALGAQAFAFNEKLLSFDLTRVKKIGELAFAFNTATKKVVVPGTVEEMGDAAFAYQLNLEEVVVCEGVTSLPQEAFSAYSENTGGSEVIGSNLEKITLPSTLESLGTWAFYGAGLFINAFSPVTVSLNTAESKLREIGKYAFMYSGIEELYLPASVETVDAGAFAGCGLLRSVTFGSEEHESRLTSVGDIAFYSLPKLTSVTVYKTVTAAEEVPALSFAQGVPFYNDPNSPYIYFKIYVPEASLDWFRADSGWANYDEVIEAIAV